MEADRLETALAEAFDAPAAERRVVVRQALDLEDAGRYAETHDVGLTPDRVVAALGEAPAGSGLADRWNWWIGALEVAHGDYARFSIRRWRG